MNPTQATTPFGRRTVTFAKVESQVAAKARPSEAVFHKCQVFPGISEGRGAIGVLRRTRCVIEPLLTFHAEPTLTGAADTVVFPTKEQLTHQSRHIAPATLQRHLLAAPVARTYDPPQPLGTAQKSIAVSAGREGRRDAGLSLPDISQNKSAASVRVRKLLPDTWRAFAADSRWAASKQFAGRAPQQ